jgi:ABC-2 type transport system permease protein
MAVYERSWRRYSGPTTPLRSRFLVVTRYALQEAFASRLFTAFYAACFLPSLLGVLLVYLSHNLGLLEQLGLTQEFMGGLTMAFFRLLFLWQAVPAFFVAVIVAPSLMAADLSCGALPLYLCRPLNRSEYVLGKMAVLFVLISPATWMSGQLVFWLQAYLEGGGWWRDNWRIAVAYLIGHLVWILVISLLSLAISVWLGYKPAARGALFGVIFILTGFAQAVNAITGTAVGDLFHLVRAIASVVMALFGMPTTSDLPVIANWLTLAAFALFSVWLLNRKLRAHEVVR